jgi:hypothetical protein
MNASRREASHSRHGQVGFRLLLLMAGLVIAAGCSRAPKPRAEPPADTTRTTEKSAPPKRPAGTGSAQAGTGVVAGSSTSTTAVVPKLSVEERERLESVTGVALEAAQKAVDAVDAKKLDVEQHRKYLIAKDFLAQATEARTRREYERAQGLALKARLLAEEFKPR